MAASNGTASGGSEDVARMQALLREAGVTEYEPRVLSQLLDVSFYLYNAFGSDFLSRDLQNLDRICDYSTATNWCPSYISALWKNDN